MKRASQKRSTERPLTPAVLHILMVLADGEQHGYAILKEAERLSGGRLRLGPGTLYRSLQELLAQGWIEESVTDPADARRRTYRLSRRGRSVLRVELDRLASLVDAARARDLLSRPGTEGTA
jgi:DNA-binding PadR family transcriptional regulator